MRASRISPSEAVKKCRFHAKTPFHCEDGQVVYVHGHLPVFQHRSDDLESFRLFTSQLILTGAVRRVDIAEAFQRGFEITTRGFHDA